MGESTNPRATLRFDRRVWLEFRGDLDTEDDEERQEGWSTTGIVSLIG